MGEMDAIADTSTPDEKDRTKCEHRRTHQEQPWPRIGQCSGTLPKCSKLPISVDTRGPNSTTFPIKGKLVD